MPSSYDSLIVRDADGTLPALSVINAPTVAKGIPAVNVLQSDATAAAVVARGGGTLLDLQSTAGVSQFRVGSDGSLTSAGLPMGQLHLAAEPTGTLAATISSHLLSSSTVAAFSNGSQVAVNSIALSAGTVVSNIAILAGGTPANGPTHFWVALLDSTLHVLTVSADQGSGAISASTFYKLAVTPAYTVPSTGLYYIAASVTTSVTAPTAVGVAATGSAAGLTAPVPFGTAGTQAAPPALAAQLNSGTVTFATAGNFAAWIS